MCHTRETNGAIILNIPSALQPGPLLCQGAQNIIEVGIWLKGQTSGSKGSHSYSSSFLLSWFKEKANNPSTSSEAPWVPELCCGWCNLWKVHREYKSWSTNSCAKMQPSSFFYNWMSNLSLHSVMWHINLRSFKALAWNWPKFQETMQNEVLRRNKGLVLGLQSLLPSTKTHSPDRSLFTHLG